MNSAELSVLCPSSQLPPLRAVSAIRPLIGRSGPFLIRADDGFLYVLKTSGNKRHPNLLANEFLGSTFCAAVGLPVATSRMIELSRGFLEIFDLSAQYGGYTHRPEPGMHYGSQMVLPSHHKTSIDPEIDQNLVEYVQNRQAFLGMYVLDLCVGHRAQRQAIFIKDMDGPASRAVFIDHSHMFGGSKWDLESLFPPPLHRLATMYDGLASRKAILSILKAFSASLPNAVDSAIKFLHSEWYSGDLDALQAWLHHRIECLPDIVGQALERTLILGKDTDAAFCVQNPGVCQVRT